MNSKPRSIFKSLSRVLVVTGLVVTLALNSAAPALAARSGGRIGGGGFRRSVPSQPYRQSPSRYPGGGYGYPGGGIGFPFLIPFFGIGGGFGGLFTVLIFLAIANFLVQSFRRGADGGSSSYGDSYSNPPVSLTRLQVGLLSEARSLQTELNQIAQNANTGSGEGLSLVLQETVLALLRHPEYWAYAGTETQQARLEGAEEKFNRLVLTERSKLQAETLSNVNRQLQQSANKALPGPDSQELATQAPGEYIIVTLLVAAQGNLKLARVGNAEDLRQALNQLGAVSTEQLLALEVLWEPQAEGDTLTSEELISEYPDLKLV